MHATWISTLDVRVLGLELVLEHGAVLVVVIVLEPRVHAVRVRAVARDLDLASANEAEAQHNTLGSEL